MIMLLCLPVDLRGAGRGWMEGGQIIEGRDCHLFPLCDYSFAIQIEFVMLLCLFAEAYGWLARQDYHSWWTVSPW